MVWLLFQETTEPSENFTVCRAIEGEEKIQPIQFPISSPAGNLSHIPKGRMKT